jgi:hypothetical protein
VLDFAQKINGLNLLSRLRRRCIGRCHVWFGCSCFRNSRSENLAKNRNLAGNGKIPFDSGEWTRRRRTSSENVAFAAALFLEIFPPIFLALSEKSSEDRFKKPCTTCVLNEVQASSGTD